VIYGQTWHLPCDDSRLTYKFIAEIESQLKRKKNILFYRNYCLIAALFDHNLRETQELLPRYAIDNIFESSKFKEHFPNFTTTYQRGIQIILQDYKIK
jgi:hypothetical protein